MVWHLLPLSMPQFLEGAREGEIRSKAKRKESPKESCINKRGSKFQTRGRVMKHFVHPSIANL